ncbi:DUF6355 family natural product biosynthesis protein [Amycolatopsis plumensis]|uniref:DUF6355 family natural product biosynthesis protein n=1 Tax=Amycolatopsis plumensis TaxID=236508 RepID=A0ABV5UCQ1_9PSEU
MFQEWRDSVTSRLRTWSTFIVGIAAAVLTVLPPAVAAADTPPSGCGFHKVGGTRALAYFNNCSIYAVKIHVDVVLDPDREFCVSAKNDYRLGTYGTILPGRIQNAWSLYVC